MITQSRQLNSRSPRCDTEGSAPLLSSTPVRSHRSKLPLGCKQPLLWGCQAPSEESGEEVGKQTGEPWSYSSRGTGGGSSAVQAADLCGAHYRATASPH